MSGFEIAIVGASCRLPQAADLPALAELLFSGRDAVTEIPPDRWSRDFYFDPDPKQPGKSYTFAGGVLERIDQFDAGFFGMSPREASNIDPQQRLLLELAYEAMEDAGMAPSRLGGRAVGVFVGASAWDYSALNAGDMALADAPSMQGIALSSISNRVSYAFNLKGPSLTVDTACSSAMVALHLACQAINRGEAEAALVGGVNLLISPHSYVGFSRASMLSPTGRCHAFDARADGYVRSEGGGILLLKPLDKALADGDPVRAVIRATGVNSDGRTNGIAVPSRAAQAALLREVYDRAGVEPDDLAYLEAHGTGTPVGDPIECAAIGEALATRRATPLPIGSVKTNLGHLEAASGMAGLLKLLVAFERGAAPPSLYGETPNPNIPFGDLNLALLHQAQPLVGGPKGVLAGINSFGFGGTNAHAVLAAPPAPARAEPPAHSTAPGPLLLSARSDAALRDLAALWSRTVAEAAPRRLPALIRGAARRRETQPYRLAAPAGDVVALADSLAAFAAGEPSPGTASGQAVDGKLALVFSGNGSQWAGMGRDAYALNPAFRAAVDEVDARLAPRLGWSVAERMKAGLAPGLLRRTDVAQPLLFAVQVGTVAALRAFGIEADAHLGHSVGEVAAAWAAGALDLDQACRVIAERSRLQQTRHGSGGMAVLGLDQAAAEALIAACAPGLSVAAINSAGSVTVAGPDQDLQAMAMAARARSTVFSRLDLDYAFHSPAMDPLRAPLQDALAGLASAPPRTPLISTVTGEPVGAGDLGAAYWWRNVRAPVRFADGLQGLIGSGYRLFLEIGPQPSLQSYLRAGLKQAEAQGAILSSLSAQPAADDPFADIAARIHVAGRSIAGATLFDGEAAVRGLPAYPWSRQRYWTEATSEALLLSAPLQDHPLLGFRRDPRRQTWVSHLSTSRFPWMEDHRVDGAVVLPAAAMIDMALAAARVRNPDAGALELRDIEIFKPMILDEAREVVSHTGETGGFEITSRARIVDEAPVVHVAGRLAVETFATPLFRASAAAAPQSVIEADEFYARNAALRVEHGPVFRSVRRAVVFSPESAEIEFAGDALPGEGWLIDPTILDGAFQGILATKSLSFTQPGDSVVPWRFGRIRLLRRDHGPVVRARCELTRVGPKAHCADIALYDADGAIVAELLECWFVRIRPGEAAGDERGFWTALVPTSRQPPMPFPLAAAEAALAALPGADDAWTEASQLMARAYAAAAAHEALRPLADQGGRLEPDALIRDGRLAADGGPLLARLAGQLAAEGLAQREGAGWRLDVDPELPAAAAIWQSLLTDNPAASAEAALLGGAGSTLPRALAEGPGTIAAAPEGLVQQLLFASPAGEVGLRALEGAVAALAAHWPAGRPLRIALIGEPPASLARRFAVLLARPDGPAVLLTAATADTRALEGLDAALRKLPGAGARLWVPAEDPLGAALGDDGFDVIIGVYAFARARAASGAVAGLLVPGGLLLALEPVPGPVWDHAFPGDEQGMVEPDVWAERLALFGCAGAGAAVLPGVMWSTAVVSAMRPQVAHAPGDVRIHTADEDAHLALVLGDADGALAAGLISCLAEHRRTAALPLDALAEVLGVAGPAGWRDVILAAPRSVSDSAALAVLATLGGVAAAGAAAAPGVERTRIWIVTEGGPDNPAAAGLSALRRVMTNEGLDVRFLRIEPGVAYERLADEILAPSHERDLVLTAAGRFAPRLRQGLPAGRPKAGDRRLEITRPGLLNSLEWATFDAVVVGRGQVAIDVRAAGLNFRDVMWALGMLPDEALLDGFGGPTLGLECAGIVTAIGEGVEHIAVGDRVAAVAPSALATRVVTEAHAVLPLPPQIDFAAGATLPVTAMTVVYALGRLADLQPGERVLIHGALGGVGLAAIQYARSRGAEIFATAGSPLKRDLLQLLGVEHVFDSRSAGFADQILLATGGEGVDVVLNSLSGELMQESLRLMKPFGRFLEIGKRDLFRNTEVGLRPLRKNVSYFAIDADQLPRLRPALAASLFREIGGLVADGTLRPLPYRTFGFDQTVEAFRLMQGSGHIGKIVLVPRAAPAAAPVAVAPFKVRADRPYVITGGTAGFGLETGRWLAGRGARRLALLGRRGADTPGLTEALADLKAEGVEAQAYACDVSDEIALARVLAEIRTQLGPIAGVVHAAMVMDDGLLADLDADRFAHSLAPKLGGASALDRLTRTDPVEMFVIYSSISAAIGNPGQGNYAVANAAAEAVAARRRREGLPGLAVQWGPISDAGYLARETRLRDVLERVLASGELTARGALDALPGLSGAGAAIVGQARVTWDTLRRQIPVGATPLFADLAETASGLVSERSLKEQVAELSSDEARALVIDLLAAEVSGILRLPRDKIDVDQAISDMGFDSLMALELRLAIETRLGQELPLLSVGGATTLRAIAARIVRTAHSGDAKGDDVLERIARHEAVPDPQAAEAAR